MGSTSPNKTDLIAAFAERNCIELVINEHSVRVSRLTHPSLAVLDTGFIPKGRLVASEIRRAVDLLHHLYSDQELKRLDQLAVLADEFGVEFHRDPTRAQGSLHPIAGALGLSHYYPALVPRRGEHPGLKILRALLLRVISASRKHKAAQPAARLIRDVLTVTPTQQFDQAASDALAAQWHPNITANDLGELISNYFAEKSDAPKAFAQAALEPPVENARPASDGHSYTDTTPSTPNRPSGIVRIGGFKAPPASLV